MFEIKIEAKGALAGLKERERATQDMTPLARSISLEFLSQTEANFAAQGRPKWMGLKPSTISQRERQGTWPGMILKRTAGGLADSLSISHDSTSATIGSNKKYAAIHQLGGDAGRGRKVKIEPRPYLPVDAKGDLQPEAEESIIGIANDYLRRINS